MDFGAVLVSDTKGTTTTTDDVNYTTFKADVDSASLVGIEGLTATVTSLRVVANRTSSTTAPNTVLDFVNTAETVNTTDTTATSRTIATGPGNDPVTLDVDGDEGGPRPILPPDRRSDPR